MSSTNRGAERQPDDFYETPADAVDSFLQAGAIDLHDARVLEPGCGRGAIIKRVIRAGVAPERIAGVELDEGRAFDCLATGCNMHRGSFLDFPWEHVDDRFDIAISNPPYSLAMEFIEHARAIATVSCFLLRLNFLGSQDRSAWHRANPSDIYILPKRPCFTGHLRAHSSAERCRLKVPSTKKPPEKWERCARVSEHDGECITIGTDSCEYAWFVWGPNRGGRWKLLEAAK